MEEANENSKGTEIDTTVSEPTDYDWSLDRFKELNEGQIIDAKVVLVRDDAAFVDIGGKSDLTIPLEDLTVQQAISAKDLVRVGDVIQVMVTRTGDEDKIRLSRRLVEQEKVWLELEKSFEQKSRVKATVTAAIKGGLSVNVNGVKGFMPASQAALSYIKDLAGLVGQEFPVQILEFDRAKHRVVVSRRVILEEERKRAEAEFFATIHENDRKSGTVTRITDFGAFVDLGSGIEGLIHISELSWERVKSVRDILMEGDRVEVLVTKIDPASKRISLSLRQIQQHPWDLATQNLREGETVTGKVVRMESFGAFINLAPGVDGLAHISQISDKHIAKPDEVLSAGHEVQAKIIKLDRANLKISLSLKEVLQDQHDEEMAGYLNDQDSGAVTQNLGELLKKETK